MDKPYYPPPPLLLGVADGVKGPCGGLFWSEKPGAPFIVACFKGTTPTSTTSFFVSTLTVADYSEYIVDATFEKCDARAYLHGAAHQGFFYSLFPSFSRLGLRFSPHGVRPHLSLPPLSPTISPAFGRADRDTFRSCALPSVKNARN
jgi:hypothetical protein